MFRRAAPHFIAKGSRWHVRADTFSGPFQAFKFQAEARGENPTMMLNWSRHTRCNTTLYRLVTPPDQKFHKSRSPNTALLKMSEGGFISTLHNLRVFETEDFQVFRPTFQMGFLGRSSRTHFRRLFTCRKSDRTRAEIPLSVSGIEAGTPDAILVCIR